MIELIKTSAFDAWLRGLRDRRAIARIAARIDHGSGYRVYFMPRGSIVIVLLCAGDKATQQRDIEQARALAAEWKD